MAFVATTILILLSIGALGLIPDKDSSDGDAFTHEGIEYLILSEKDLTLTVSACKNATLNMTIPDKIIHEGKEYTVVQIGDSAFYKMHNIRNIVLPDTLVSIGNESFYECVGIESMTIPSSVRTIHDLAFTECKGLRQIVLNEGLLTIGERAFLNCIELASVRIPSSVTSIGTDAFGQNDSLNSISVDKNNEMYASIDGVLFDKDLTELILCPINKKGHLNVPDGVRSIGIKAFYMGSISSITLPDTLKNIGAYAFFKCKNIESICVPANVVSIEIYAFRECERLTTIEVDSDNETYTSVDGALYDKERTTLLMMPNGKGGSLCVPDGVIAIDEYSFYKNENIESVHLPDSVIEIGYCSFAETTNLRTVNIPSNLEWMGDYAFNLSGIESANIPSTLENPSEPGWGITTFQHCNNLTTVVIEEGITKIPDFTFEQCYSLEVLTLPSTLSELGAGVFTECSSLESIALPGSIKTIPEYTFYFCTELTTVVLEEGLISIGDNALSYCSSIISLHLPDSLTDIGQTSFESCDELRTLHIGKGLIGIGEDAFLDCSNLREFVVSKENKTYCDIDGVLFIDDALTLHTYPSGKEGDYAIPSGTREIWNFAFLRCDNLTAVHIPASVLIFPTHPIYDCPSLERITVDKENPNLTSIDGVLFNKDLTYLIKCPERMAGDYLVPDQTKVISENAFDGCIDLRSVTLGENVTTLESDAFYNCINLSSVTLSPGLKIISDSAFLNCSALTTIRIPSTVGYIGENAFMLSSIESYEVETGNPNFSSMDGVLFNGDGTVLLSYPRTKAGPYTIPPNVTSVNDGAFEGCLELTSLTIPKTINMELEFEGCINLKEIVVGDDIKSLSTFDGALFNNDLSILKLCPFGRTSIRIPSETFMFATFSFIECTYLEKIILEGGDRIVIEGGAFSDFIGNVTFESGREGYELDVYMDYAHTVPFSTDYINKGDPVSIYLEWTEIPESGNDLDITLWTAMGTILAICIATVLTLRRPH